jgi:hypothetical protein
MKWLLAAGLIFSCLSAYADEGQLPTMCPVELSYDECVDQGYFNGPGNGVGGGGGGGGYCQNVLPSRLRMSVRCADGGTYVCPNELCYNEPNSHKFCDPPEVAPCCTDGTHEGQVVFEHTCA